MNTTHEWLCPACTSWNPDREEATRCDYCFSHRPDIPQYRKVRAAGPNLRARLEGWARLQLAKAARPDVLWVCEGCAQAHGTVLNFCPECGRSRPVHPELRLNTSASWGRVIWAAVLTAAGSIWLGLTVPGGWIIAAAVNVIIWGDQLGRRR